MINHSYLLGLYGMPVDASGGYPSASTPAKKTQPTAPWSPSAEKPEASALVRAAMAGRRIINEASTEVDLRGASPDYRKMFALYQGLSTLSAVADRATTRGLSSSEQAQLSRRFASGLDELSTWMGKATFEGVHLVQGVSSSTVKSSAGVARDSAKSITGPVHEGALTAAVAAFQGDVRFGISITTLSGTKTVDIDLADMGATPRTLDAVVLHVNNSLQAQGVQTRLGREAVETPPRTIKVGEKTITLPPRPDQWALAVRGVSTETVRFTAPQVSDAVYVVQAAGADGGHQLLKFQSDIGSAPAATQGVGETWWVDGRASQTGLPDGVAAVRASATGPDGSLWIVADLDAGPANQPIKGERDVALMKFDTAGRLVATRAIGAASTASGYAIAVDADGRVAVAGSVTGALEPGASGVDAAVADSFVTVFDGTGKEVWTQRRGARAADEATAVSFGPGGMVYVGGRAKSAMAGGAALGGWDGYLQAFTETQVHSLAPIVASPGAAAQFGTAGDDGVSAVTVDGSNLYTAGVENGRAVVRRYTLDAAGAPTLSDTRDLGSISGEIAGVAVTGGRVVITGTTRNAALDAGTITRAHAGGTDAFVATLSTDLQAAAGDRLTYYGGAGDDTAADVKVHDGKVWITGISDRPAGAGAEDPTKGYLARLDPLTGAVEWSRTWIGDDQQAAPMTLAVASGGASVLDRLGLPQGEISQGDSKLLTAATSVRAGDRFFVSPAGGGRPVAVTIEARDTLQTLARKIETASRMTLKVTIALDGADKDGGAAVSAGGFQRLSIVARDGRDGAVLSAGEPGRDALAGLGLSAGFVKPSGDDAVQAFGLDLPRTLSLSGPDAIKAAQERLKAAMTAVRNAYRSLGPKLEPAVGGTVSPYLSAQLANYQSALSRLTA